MLEVHEFLDVRQVSMFVDGNGELFPKVCPIKDVTIKLELSDSTFFTITIVLDPIFTIDDSIAIVCTISNFVLK